MIVRPEAGLETTEQQVAGKKKKKLSQLPASSGWVGRALVELPCDN